MKLKLVENWRTWHKWWSAQWMMLGGFFWFLGFIPAETFLFLFNLVPVDLQMLLPGREIIVPLCFIIAFIARGVEQPKLAKEKSDAEVDR